MNILVLNGSPKGAKSNTLKVTNAFLEGLSSENNHSIDIIRVYKSNIEHCLGCFSCWTKTPGKCIIKDDMSELIEKYINADVVLWSFPLYYFGMPSKIKAFLDRLLPTSLPVMSINEDETSGHPPRYDLSHQRHILISTCGFYSKKDNYTALLQQFDIMFKDSLTTILCPEGELLNIPQLSGRINEYLSHVRKAGDEFNRKGQFTDDTRNKLNELLYPPEAYVEMANASWEINESDDNNNDSHDRSYKFMRQMAAVYNNQSYVQDVVIEMYFTDINKTYQLVLGKNKCTVLSDNFAPYTTRIETSFDLWLKISNGEISGSEAMMKQQYKVMGEFETMMKMETYFGTKKEAVTENQGKPKKTNMNILLFQWIVLWVFLPINKNVGATLGIFVCSLIPLLSYKYSLTIYDKISGILVSVISLMVLLSFNEIFAVCLTYLIFGVIWLISCLTEIPLTAHYSKNGYGGDEAFDNPLFIKTNRILTFIWGALYLLTAVGTYYLMNSTISMFTGLINTIVPTFMGAFTLWFSKWYPAKVARG
jgi:multimeric flavodoxin WrbA/putative sterol carrier protein